MIRKSWLLKVIRLAAAFAFTVLCEGGAEAQNIFRLANRDLTVILDSSRGDLLAIGNSRGANRGLGPAASNSLWRLELMNPPKTLTAADARRFRIGRGASRSEAILSWSDFGLAAAPQLMVEARVSVEEKAPRSHWRIQLSGLSALRPARVAFPRLASIPRAAGERTAVPLWMGQETTEIRRLLSDQKSHRLEWAYPGLLSMQCLAVSALGTPGVYLACNDNASFQKVFAMFAAAPGELGCEVVHLPEIDPAAGTWHQPYDVLLGTLEGDWLTAAERYRAWATNQPWARQSRLSTEAMPDWAMNTALWVWNRGRSGQVLTPARELQDRLKLPVNVFWHWWHGCAYDSGFPEYLPPREGAEAFRSALADAQRQNVHALVYMNQRLWGMTTASWTNEHASAFAVKQADGSVRAEVYNTFTKAPCASMCMGTQFWRDKYASLAERAVHELGVDGIYMDQACTSLPCYDPAHAHSPGGGRFWMQGFRQLEADIRNRCGTGLSRKSERPLAAQKSSLVLAGEGCGESWLPYLDLMLSLQVSRERYAGDDRWETIPFFHAVYHPYAVTFGNYSSLTMPPYDELWPEETAPKEPLKLLDSKYARQFRLEQARAFVWGQQPTIANFQPSQFTTRSNEIQYVARLAGLRRRAPEYLLHGTYVRPPEIHVEQARLDMSRLSIYAGQQGGPQGFHKECPLALAGAWKAAGGSVGVPLASIAEDPVRLALKIDPAVWNLTKPGIFLTTELGEKKHLGNVGGVGVNLNLQLPAYGACLLELGPGR